MTLLTRIRKNIITGIFVIIPLALSLWIVIKIFLMVDNWIYSLLPVSFEEHMVPGVGFIIFLVIAYIIGLLTKFYIGRKIIDLGNALISGIPFFNKIYRAIQQIVDSIANPNKKVLEKVVLIEYPQKGSYCLGFMTSSKCEESMAKIDPTMVSVFLPTSPNPTTGFLIFIPASKITEIEMAPETAIKLILSFGILTPDGKSNEDLYAFSNKMKELLGSVRKFDKKGTLVDPRD